MACCSTQCHEVSRFHFHLSACLGTPFHRRSWFADSVCLYTQPDVYTPVSLSPYPSPRRQPRDPTHRRRHLVFEFGSGAIAHFLVLGPTALHCTSHFLILGPGALSPTWLDLTNYYSCTEGIWYTWAELSCSCTGETEKGVASFSATFSCKTYNLHIQVYIDWNISIVFTNEWCSVWQY